MSRKQNFHKQFFPTSWELNHSKTHLVDVLSVATKEQVFLFTGALYEQTDGLVMGSSLGLLLANVLMSSIEENLEGVNSLLSIDDMLTIRSLSNRM